MKLWMPVVLVAACSHSGGGKPEVKKKAPEDVKKEWSPKVQAKLEKIVAAAKAAHGAELGAPGDAKLALDFNVGNDEHPNAIAVQSDDVESATAPRPKPLTQEEQMKAWSDAAFAANGSDVPPMPVPGRQHPYFTFESDGHNLVYEAKELLGIESPEVLPEWAYDQFVNAKYVLVVTPADVQWPVSEGSTFTAGSVKVRAVLVDIDSAKPLGGFEAVAQNSEDVSVKYKRTDDINELLAKKAEDDFLSEYGKAIRKGIEQRWPDAKTPVLGWGP